MKPLIVSVFLDVKRRGLKETARWFERGHPYPFWETTSVVPGLAARRAREYLAKHNASPEDAWIYKDERYPRTVLVDTTRKEAA